MHILNSIKTGLRKELKCGRTLVYFASGTKIREEYRNLPYENVILVDSRFGSLAIRSDLKRPNLYVDNGIICLGMDAIQAVFLLKELNWKVNCVIGLNEGLYEGGGHYAINGDSFLGYLFPTLADEVIHIGYKDYYHGKEYQHLNKHWLDIPYQKRQVLTLHDHNYISPGIFTESERYAQNAEVTLLSRKSVKKKIIESNGKEIQLKHESIWSELALLDAAFIRYENDYQRKIILELEQQSSRNMEIFPLHLKNRLDPFTTYDCSEIISLCHTNKWENIGLVPHNGNYNLLLKLALQQNTEYPKKLTLYHLNKNDFAELYYNDNHG